MIKPLWANVLMKRDKLATKSIIIPEQYEKENAPMRGTVVSKGPTAEDDIHVGGMYLHGAHSGMWINAEGKFVRSVEDGEFYIVNEQDLIAEVKNV